MITHDQLYAPPPASLNGLQTLILTQALKPTGHTPEGVGEVFGISARDAVDHIGHASEANSNRESPPWITVTTGPEARHSLAWSRRSDRLVQSRTVTDRREWRHGR